MSARYLITGGAGQVGSHLAEHLLARGDAVVVLDDLSTGSRENLPSHPRLELVEGSVLNEALVARWCARCDAVFHLAAAVGVRQVVDRALRSMVTNVHGTETVLRAACERARPVLLASSSEVYGKGAAVPFREDGDIVLGPTTCTRWSYACSKAVDEFLALAYAREQGLPVVIARLFNTVGPRQIGRYGMVIPRLVAQGLAGEALTVYGDGAQTRSFAHAADVAAMLAAMLDHPGARSQVFNVGADEEVTLDDLAARVRAKTGYRAEVRHVAFTEAFGPDFEDLRRRAPDLQKLRGLLGPLPTRSLDAILDEVVERARRGRAN